MYNSMLFLNYHIYILKSTLLLSLLTFMLIILFKLAWKSILLVYKKDFVFCVKVLLNIKIAYLIQI